MLNLFGYEISLKTVCMYGIALIVVFNLYTGLGNAINEIKDNMKNHHTMIVVK